MASQTVIIIILSVVIFVMGICNITYFLFKRFPMSTAAAPPTLRAPVLPVPATAPSSVPVTSSASVAPAAPRHAGAPRHDGLPAYDVEEASIGLNPPTGDRKA